MQMELNKKKYCESNILHKNNSIYIVYHDYKLKENAL